MSKKLISARQWGVTPLVLLMSVGLGSQPGSAVFEQPAKEKAQQESVESRSKEESDQPIVFEQSLEVSTHLSLIEERELGGDAVREAEIPDLGTALRSEPGLGRRVEDRSIWSLRFEGWLKGNSSFSSTELGLSPRVLQGWIPTSRTSGRVP